VSRKRHLRGVGKYIGLMTLGIASTVVSAWLLLCACIDIFDLSGDRPASLTVRDLLIGAALSACGVVVGIVMVVKGTKTEIVELTKPQNGRLLPMKGSLLRASSLPPAQQQTELLRAAQYGKEAPAEELLRAGEESRHDD
jgi:hypothetical protein